MKVKDKIIVVTGSGNGIGRELALNLLAKGAHVAAVDINAPALEETAHLASPWKEHLSTHVVDITDRAGVEALVDQVVTEHGAVDVIINNAWIIQPFVRLNDLTYHQIQKVMDVNLYGTLYMIKAFLPRLLQRPVAHITNVSSMGGFLPVPGQSAYGASKAAVKLLTEGLYSELLSTNVRVTLVYPGAINTNIAANSGIEVPGGSESVKSSIKPLAPEKAARTIVDAIEKDRYSVLVGPDARLMDLLYRLSPKMAAGFIYKQMKALLPA